MEQRPASGVIPCDVLVVGMGAAGLAAAIEARAAGASVIVLEKAPEHHAGGQTRVSGATWFDNRDPERAAVYLRNLCCDRPIPEPIVTAWAEETFKNTAWVESLGATVNRMEFAPGFPELDGSDCFGGLMHVGDSWGMGRLFEVLVAAARSREIELRYDTRAVELVRHPSTGSIAGVRAVSAGLDVTFDVRCGVVLATGGFQANAQMLEEFVGLSGAQQWGSPYNTGDGHRMAMHAGSDLWHMSNYYPMVGMRMDGYASGMSTFLSSHGFVYVALDGQRFFDESTHVAHGHALVHGRYELFPTQPMWVVFDERTRCAGPLTMPFELGPFGWSQLVDGYRWSNDNRAEIDAGWIISAPTVPELAVQMELDPAVLAAAIERYNRSCGAGVDEHLDRDPSTLVALENGPFYAFRWGPVLNFTCGGPRRNERSQAIDTLGSVVPRLYCAGEMSMSYSMCFDSGMPIADALAFGRIAGRNCAAEVPLA
ncbi:MAG: FAD-dependent oxidoreductase [Acidimicrobiia bacterium]